MDCFKCTCDYKNLSKEELKVLIGSCGRINDFLSNRNARCMFRKMFYSDEPDRYAPQPSGSANHPVGRAPKPNAIKYLEIIEEAENLLQANDVSEEKAQELADKIVVALSDRLYDSTDTNRAEVLEAIVAEYGNLLCETKEYNKFISNLTKAYEGKLKIEK